MIHNKGLTFYWIKVYIMNNSSKNENSRFEYNKMLLNKNPFLLDANVLVIYIFLILEAIQ